MLGLVGLEPAQPPSRAAARGRPACRGPPGTRRRRRGRAPGRSRAPPAAAARQASSSSSCASKKRPARMCSSPALYASAMRSNLPPRGDDPAVWGRPLLPGKLEALLPEHQLDHGRPHRRARPRHRRHRARRRRRRSPTRTPTSRSSATRTTPTPPGLRAGHAAGFDQVVVKSALVERAAGARRGADALRLIASVGLAA